MVYLFQNEERLEDIAFLTQMNNFMTYVSYFFTTLVALSFLGGVIYLIKNKNKKEKTIGWQTIFFFLEKPRKNLGRLLTLWP